MRNDFEAERSFGSLVSSDRHSRSFLAVVTMVTFMPCGNSTAAESISGKTVCSLRPIK